MDRQGGVGGHGRSAPPPFFSSHAVFDRRFQQLRRCRTTTSLSLGRHWEDFIRAEVESGRYGSASEVVRDALRALEDRKQRRDALRAHLAQGAAESARGVHVEDFSMAKVARDADRGA